MNKEEGRKEIVYQMTMAAAKKLFKEGLITREQYEQFDTVMRQKYEIDEEEVLPGDAA